MNESAVALKEPMQSVNESFNVPKTYLELQVRFGPHITKLLQRHNEYPGNFEDLHSYVWLRLLEAKLLERFEEYLKKNGLKVLSATQVCEFLGISWQQWVDASVASHTGARRNWMPTPVNVAEYNIEGVSWYDVPTALFSFADIERLTFGERINGVVCWPFEDDWDSSFAQSVMEAVSCLKYPPIFSTESHFRNYLNRAVLNSYANFCRTKERRHKERPQSPQGSEGHMTSWEDNLVEQSQASMEHKLAASEARTMLSEALQKCFDDASIPCTGGEGFQVCALLEQGVSLSAALKQCGYPTKLRKSVISSIKSRSEALAEAPELD